MSIKKWIDERYPEPNIYRWIGFILEAISASVLFFFNDADLCGCHRKISV